MKKLRSEQFRKLLKITGKQVPQAGLKASSILKTKQGAETIKIQVYLYNIPDFRPRHLAEYARFTTDRKCIGK